MTEVTKAFAQQMRDAWLAAELAVTSGQSYSIGEVSVTRADLHSIRKNINYWQGVMESFDATAAGGTSRVALATFGNTP